MSLLSSSFHTHPRTFSEAFSFLESEKMLSTIMEEQKSLDADLEAEIQKNAKADRDTKEFTEIGEKQKTLENKIKALWASIQEITSSLETEPPAPSSSLRKQLRGILRVQDQLRTTLNEVQNNICLLLIHERQLSQSICRLKSSSVLLPDEAYLQSLQKTCNAFKAKQAFLKAQDGEFPSSSARELTKSYEEITNQIDSVLAAQKDLNLELSLFKVGAQNEDLRKGAQALEKREGDICAKIERLFENLKKFLATREEALTGKQTAQEILEINQTQSKKQRLEEPS